MSPSESLQVPSDTSSMSDSSSILTDLSEDNDVPAHENLNGLLIWQANGQQKLQAKLQERTSQVQVTTKKLWGHYKAKWTKQSKWTKQHHAKQAWDVGLRTVT